MQRRYRLTRATDFQRVRQQGKAYAHPLLVLVLHPNPAGGVRVGVSASRRLGKAVQRNRAKRRLRAAIQPLLPRLFPGWDLLLLARAPLLEAPFQEVKAAVEELCLRSGILHR